MFYLNNILQNKILKKIAKILLLVSILFISFIWIFELYTRSHSYVIFKDMIVLENAEMELYSVVAPNKYILKRENYDIVVDISKRHYGMENITFVLKAKNNLKLDFRENKEIGIKEALLDSLSIWKTEKDGFPKHIFHLTGTWKPMFNNLIYTFKSSKSRMKEDYKDIKKKKHFIILDIINEKNELIASEKLYFDFIILGYGIGFDSW